MPELGTTMQTIPPEDFPDLHFQAMHQTVLVKLQPFEEAATMEQLTIDLATME
jgi:hypothetical protein